MKAKEVKRNIYYYDLSAYYLDEDTNTVICDKTSRILDDFFCNLHSKQKETKNYTPSIISTEYGDNFFIIVDRIEESFIEYRLALCRKDALPFIEKEGKLESLGEYIDDNQNIAEITHCVYFREYAVVGSEFNFSGARASAVAEYIMRMDRDIKLVLCKAKINLDAYSKLIADEEYSLFNFAVKSNSKAYDELLSKKSIFSVMKAEVPESDTIQIILKKRKTMKNKHKGFDSPFTQGDIKSLLLNYREDIKKFCVSQGTYNDSVDLLSDKLTHKVKMIRTKKRTIDSKVMYKEIRTFFDLTVVKHCENKN